MCRHADPRVRLRVTVVVLRLAGVEDTLSWQRPKPNLSCLDCLNDWTPPVTARTPYVRGMAIGTKRTRRFVAKLSLGDVVELTGDEMDRLREPKYNPEEIKARIAEIRREKELLRRLEC